MLIGGCFENLSSHRDFWMSSATGPESRIRKTSLIAPIPLFSTIQLTSLLQGCILSLLWHS